MPFDALREFQFHPFEHTFVDKGMVNECPSIKEKGNRVIPFPDLVFLARSGQQLQGSGKIGNCPEAGNGIERGCISDVFRL